MTPLATALPALLDRVETTPLNAGPALALGARVVFAATLAGFFWKSALTKMDGFGLSANAYAQIFPRQLEAVGYDPSQLGPLAHLMVAAGTAAEFVLPALLVLGLATRLSALAMLGFLAVMTATDIIGHGVGADTLGAPFDRDPSGVFDQRLLWAFVIAVPAAFGGGALSLDRLWTPALRSRRISPRP